MTKLRLKRPMTFRGHANPHDGAHSLAEQNTGIQLVWIPTAQRGGQ